MPCPRRKPAPLASQFAAAAAIFRQSDKPLAETEAQLSMSDGRKVTVNFNVTRDMHWRLSIPAGQWFNFGKGRRDGSRWSVPKNIAPVVITGTVARTGALSADPSPGDANGYTNVVGSFSPSGEVLLHQLDAIADGSHILRLEKNRVAPAVGGQRGSYRSSVAVAKHSLGKPRLVEPPPAHARSLPSAPARHPLGRSGR